MLTAVNFHYIRERFDEPYPGIHGVTPLEFEQQLDILGSVFSFVSGTDIVGAINGKTSLPDNALIITFDDGLAEQYHLAWPILCRKGVPAVFYVNTAPIAEGQVCDVHKTHIVRSQLSPDDISSELEAILGARDLHIPEDLHDLAKSQYRYDDQPTAELKYLINFVLAEEVRNELIETCFRHLCHDNSSVAQALYMNPEMIGELSRHDCIGTHGHDHRPMGVLEPSEIDRQIEESLRWLNEWGVRNVQGISYPYGGRSACSTKVAAVAHFHGLDYGFTMERATNSCLETPLLLARFSNSDLPGGNAAAWDMADLPHGLPRARWFVSDTR